VREHTGQVLAALGVLGPSERVTKARMGRLAGAVAAAAERFSRSLGAGQEAALSPRRLAVEVSAVVEHTPPLEAGPAPEEPPTQAKRARRRPRGSPRSS
jgi:hypothetical protein